LKYLEKMKYDVFEERERAGKTIEIKVDAAPTRLMESSEACTNIQS
jgi:hypothetical protein